MNKLPTANWPGNSGEYKAIQIDIDDEPYIRFPEENQFKKTHGGILIDILKSHSIDFEEHPEVRYYPALVGERYKVHGMGKCIIDLEPKRAIFYSDSLSTTYGIGLNPDYLNKIRELEPDWKIEIK